MKPINLLILTGAPFLALLNSLTAAPLFTETFDTAASIETWAGEPVWDATAGNPGGAVLVANNTPPGNVNYSVTFPIALSGTSDVTVTFDAISVANFAGVFHFYVELNPFDQFFIKFNNEASINDSSYTPLTFIVPDVPGSTASMTLRFEMVTGAESSANVTVAIDNIEVTGPQVDPPGTWKGYDLVDDAWVDNVGQLGWINVVNDPWLWSDNLGEWVYLPEDSEPGTAGVWYYMPPSE
jgi:hypothetical protein